MTILTECFQIRRVISTAFAQFKYMMTVSLAILKLILAVTTNAFIAFITPLFQWQPRIKRDSAIPGKSTIGQIFNREVFHLALPDRTRPYPNLPDRAAPRLSSPNLTLPLPQIKAIPYPTVPSYTIPGTTTACRTLTTNQIQAVPDLTSPDRTSTYHTVARRTLTTWLFNFLKPHNHEAPKPGAKITYADCTACELENFKQDIFWNLIVKHVNRKIQLPTRLKTRPDSNHAGALDNNRSDIQVKRLICIRIQSLRNFNTMQDGIRRYKDIALEQVFVGFSPSPLNFVTGGSLDQTSIKVNGGLKNVTLRIGVKIFTPFFRVISFTGFLFAAFAQIGKVWQWVTVLHKRGDTLDRNINGIHIHETLSFSANKTPGFNTISCQTNGGRYPIESRRSIRNYLIDCGQTKNAPKSISLTKILYHRFNLLPIQRLMR